MYAKNSHEVSSSQHHEPTYNSIFDSKDESQLWIKPSASGLQVPSLGSIRYSGKLDKKQRGLFGFNITRFYSLYGQYLAYSLTNNCSKVKRFLNLEGLKLRLFSSDNTGNAQKKFSMEFSRSGKSFQLLAKDENELENWRKQLSKTCIFLDFHHFYQIKDEIGIGADGKVFLAESVPEGRKYAAKIFDKIKMSGRFHDFRSLLFEIKVLRQLNHKNIVQLYEVFESESEVHMVFEYLQEGNLELYLEQKKCYNEKDALLLIRNILEALVYMHSQGIIHRDIKPNNIMLNSIQDDTDVKIIDFGCAAEIPNIQNHPVECGTPGYIAPEFLNQGLNSLITEKSDVFSVGAIFYELLTGRKLFEGGSYSEALRLNKKCKVELGPLQEKKLSSETVNLLMRMLEWDPRARISAKEALDQAEIKKGTFATNDTDVTL